MKKRIAVFTLATIVTTAALTAPANAGPFPGPSCAFSAVEANDTDMYELWFAPGASVIDITGDGSSDLDLFVYDASGLQVASSTGLTDSETVVIRPQELARFVIVVKNLGNSSNTYELCTE